MTSHRTGLLIIRAWIEDGSADPLRAHIRLTGDISQGIERTLTVAEPDRVHEAVAAWIQGLVDAACCHESG